MKKKRNNCSGFKVQRFRIDVQSEPLLAEKPNRLHTPALSSAYKAQPWLHFSPVCGGQITTWGGRFKPASTVRTRLLVTWGP
jgi:hypothetical protein